MENCQKLADVRSGQGHLLIAAQFLPSLIFVC